MSEHRPLTPRGALPAAVKPYFTAGPFDETGLPAGLRETHRLKPGVWGLLELTAGDVMFCWDDGGGGQHLLSAPAQMAIPPETPHHLDVTGPLRLTVTFHR